MTGSDQHALTIGEFNKLIDGTDPSKVEFDLFGNEYGARGFVKLIRDVNDKPLHFLCIAEAALMNVDIQRHTRHNIQLLEGHGEVADRSRGTDSAALTGDRDFPGQATGVEGMAFVEAVLASSMAETKRLPFESETSGIR
ncbi:hypothetical protein [uncultured Cohaesibacter sp.]|uniref:hypothetical protein n=1 Tax=uncultured Cohaesibacter sp. TaxID=1002546 RepID=UPI0029C82F37|nr:hypothetical protein [uncultured Cohaesibacter sp.]